MITPADLVASLRFDEYRSTIEQLASFGDRRSGSDSYAAAELWVAAQLAAADYVVEYHVFDTFARQELRNIYVTKIGVAAPDEMLIVGATSTAWAAEAARTTMLPAPRSSCRQH